MKRYCILAACIMGFSMQASVWEGVRSIGRGLKEAGSGVVTIVKAPFTTEDEKEVEQEQQQQQQKPVEVNASADQSKSNSNSHMANNVQSQHDKK